MLHSAKIYRKTVRARCQSVALLVHHVATKDYKHGPVWSAREASNHSVCPVTVPHTARNQGSTGVLKTSGLPTWVVNFAKPTPKKFCWMRFCVGNPLVTKFMCGQVNFFWIAHAAAECIAASLCSGVEMQCAVGGLAVTGPCIT